MTRKAKPSICIPSQGIPIPPIGLHMLSDEVSRLRVRRPAVRKSWLEHGPGAFPERRGAEPFVEIPWDEALDLVAGERHPRHCRG